MSPTSPPGLLPGPRSPRVELHPPYELTYGPAAVELTRRAGQQLDDWQGDSLDVMLGLRPDGKFACFEFAEWVSRQNGKGGIGEARVLVGFVGPLNERLILWSAHEYKTAMEAHRRIGWLLRNLGERVSENLILIPDVVLGTQADIRIKVINTNGEEAYERLDTGQRVRFVARTKGSGRGFSGDCNIVDESFAFQFVHQSALMPTLSARPNPQIVYLSSPPLDGVSGEVMLQLRRRAEAGGDDSLGYRDWGLAGDLSNLTVIDLSDRSTWAAANPALGIRITEETIERERRSMTDVDFARERLGIWPADLSEGFQVISDADWTAAHDSESNIDGPLVLAAAVSVDRSRAAIAACGRRADGRLHVEITSTPLRVDNRNGAAWVVPRLVELAERNKPAAIVIDEFGPTGSLIAGAEEAGLEVTRLGTAAAARAWGMFYDAVAGDDLDGRVLRHIGQPELTAAVAGAKRRPLGEGYAWDRRAATVDITPLVAATNALYGYATRPQDEPVEPFGFWA
ncbi:hypothetical protein [Actinoplanes regularis]|uniref:hypothetical protein n=1 Tax=Actinoplanes regularis TaxID=52697 RepID=UPI0024A46AA9|nr:hypothetical protein [Actinoplanes regularis]GLW32264.1 hypothetical protein Areg01_52030 [Actinoplanes regularis]